ncbi:MAG: DUF5667 domain-containing protein [Candidatus Uhrbacteria bacterium]|nr:DUF5667 domain-containing protein [Candidatus Uhrbacteria bacterium]
MFFLKRQLTKMKRSVRPSAEFRTRLLSGLSFAYDQEYGCSQRRPFFVRATAVGLASLALFFTVGTGVYAYESPEVTEGHPLYFVKSGIESVRERVARSPEAQAEFHAEMMERRLAEGEHHLSLHPDRVSPSLEQAANQFEQTMTAIEEGVEDESIRARLLQKLSLQRARYLELSSRTQQVEPQPIKGRELSEEEIERLFHQPVHLDLNRLNDQP